MAQPVVENQNEHQVGWRNEIERLHIIKGIVGDAEKSLLFSLHETPKRRGKTEEWKIEYIIDCGEGRLEITEWGMRIFSHGYFFPN